MSGFLFAAALTACSTGGGSSPPAPSSPATQPPQGLASMFDHVIVIVQENRTVDNMFNGFLGADTVTTGKNGTKTVPLVPVPFQPSAGHDHSYSAFVADYNNGAMNGFDHDTPKTTSYAYVRRSDTSNYWSLASRFTLSDEVFQMNMGPSYAAHVNLVAAQGGYPYALAGNPTPNVRAGCLGNNTVDVVDLRTTYPAKQSLATACTDMPTIFDLLDRKGLTWRYYAPPAGMGLNLWSAPDFVKHIALGPDHANLVNDETRILDDIANRNLPNVSYVVPDSCWSDHPRDSPNDPQGGPKWVAEITNAVGASPYWPRTLLLVTWDDWGGWYDHVAPPVLSADQLGFRVPLLIISAYPRSAGAVDHHQRTQASILSAIETIFSLGSLGQLDTKTDDLASDFRYGANPIAYGTALPSERPPPSEKCPLPSE
ncbi:MAG: hypothetical protein JO043_06715 [Candidatus Eremiobacteraeota bacterium]|nr:hypothetical protein [Candidatus Eremiobacteraeota bacterium]